MVTRGRVYTRLVLRTLAMYMYIELHFMYYSCLGTVDLKNLNNKTAQCTESTSRLDNQACSAVMRTKLHNIPYLVLFKSTVSVSEF